MEVKINAINLRSVDYKDNDKMLTLFSLERGIVSAGIKGVKKQGAKLAFASQPFCFAEYVLNEGNGRCTVTGATELESFYDLRMNLKSYYGACAIDQFLLKCAEEENSDEKLFMLTLNSLKRLNFADENAKIIVGSFLIKALDIMGYGISCGSCMACKKEDFNEEFAFFDFEKGELLCENCGYQGATRILGKTAKGLVAMDRERECEDENLNYALKFLNYYTQRKIGILCDCITQLVSF